VLSAEVARLLAPGGTDALFAPYADFSCVLLAVSGGPDSMALLLLARAWAEAPGRPALVAATVDHQLRRESAEEARTVTAWCERLGVGHRVLTWEGEKPATRIQELARQARYRLLAACAREIGAGAIVAAHHADDQVETILLRLTRGSGVAGLAGMAPISRREDLTLGRPLLGLSKSTLTAICSAAGQPFLRDPSNEDPRFARTGLRRTAALLAENGFGAKAALLLAARAARADAALARAADELAASSLIERDERSSRFRAAPLAAASEELTLRVVCSEIQRLSGRTRLRLERAESLTGRLRRRTAAGEGFAATLAGAALVAKGDVLTFEREPPRRAPRPLRAGSDKSQMPRSLGKGDGEA